MLSALRYAVCNSFSVVLSAQRLKASYLQMRYKGDPKSLLGFRIDLHVYTTSKISTNFLVVSFVHGVLFTFLLVCTGNKMMEKCDIKQLPLIFDKHFDENCLHITNSKLSQMKVNQEESFSTKNQVKY